MASAMGLICHAGGIARAVGQERRDVDGPKGAEELCRNGLADVGDLMPVQDGCGAEASGSWAGHCLRA